MTHHRTPKRDGFARLPADLHAEVKVVAALLGISVREAIAEALRAWLAQVYRGRK